MYHTQLNPFLAYMICQCSVPTKRRRSSSYGFNIIRAVFFSVPPSQPPKLGAPEIQKKGLLEGDKSTESSKSDFIAGT